MHRRDFHRGMTPHIVLAISTAATALLAPWSAFESGRHWLGAILLGAWALAVPVSALCLVAVWVAKGEADSNGATERDAGLPWPADDDITPRNQSWDHGSARTACHSLDHSLSTTDSHA